MTVSDLREVALEVLSSTLDGARRVGLVNFPNHGNPGDPGLWLGTHSLLRSLGVKVVYQSTPWSLDLDALGRAVRDAPVLINGGGNFGDLYPSQHDARMKLVRGWRDRPVIQLPQSIQFSDPVNAVAVAEAIREHGAFTMMVRDAQSVSASRALLGVEPILSPDHAFGLAPLRSSHPITRDVLWMVWPSGVAEFTPASQLADPPGFVHVEDWHTGAALAHESFDRAGQKAWTVNRKAESRWDEPSVRRDWPKLARTFEPLARRWFSRGVDMVAGSRVLVTNKMHGHIVATMLGKPHVVLDNSYGKVSGCVDTWTRDLPGVHSATNAIEALSVATTLLEESR